MNRKEVESVWVDDKEVDEFYTMRFLELLLNYDYVWSPNDQIALSINLGQHEKTQFLRDFSNFIESIDERKASKALSKIKEIYTEEYYKLLAASKNKDESRFYWFSKAHELFRESMIDESGEGKAHTGPILSQNSPAIGSGVAGEIFTFKDPLSPPSEISTDEYSLSPRAEDFTDETPLSPTAEASANDESLKTLRIHTFTNRNSLSSRHEGLADSNSLSSGDEAFAECDLSLTTSEKMTSRDFLSLENRTCRTTTSLCPATRRSLSAATRRSLSPATRRSLSPAARSSFFPAARSSLFSAARSSLFSAARSSLPTKIPERKLQPLIGLVKPTRYGNAITSYPTYSDEAWIISEASQGNDSSSNNVEGANVQTSKPTSEVTDLSNISRSPCETFSRKEKSASRPSSLCPYITDYSDLPSSCQQGTETADSCDLNNPEARRIVQSAASQTIEHVNKRSEFAAIGAARGIDSNRIFENRATSLLESLPPRLASECEAFILHFLHETLDRK